MATYTLSEFINHLRSSEKRIRNNVGATLYTHVGLIEKDLVERSPIDEDVFRRNWRSRRLSSHGKSTLFSMTIENKTSYGVFLDQGVDEEAAPWYFPNPDKPPSGKLTLVNGKVWAGGKSPSGFVIGGIIDKVIYFNNKRKDTIAKDVSHSVLGAI